VEAIYRGTNNGQTVQSLTRRFGVEALSGAQSITGQLAQKGYKVYPAVPQPEKEQRYTGGFIVQTYGSHNREGIDAMQLEFGSALRQRTSLDQTASDVAQALAVFARAYLPALK
jgi:N-formylglutamate amidohydrolase